MYAKIYCTRLRRRTSRTAANTNGTLRRRAVKEVLGELVAAEEDRSLAAINKQTRADAAIEAAEALLLHNCAKHVRHASVPRRRRGRVRCGVR